MASRRGLSKLAVASASSPRTAPKTRVPLPLHGQAQAFAQREVAAPTAALAYAIEPCFAAAFAALFLHEQLGGTQAVGGALVVLANLIA
jgi:threonine/homoserine efflux transporter RhtA